MRFEDWRVDDSKLDSDQRTIVFGGILNGKAISIKDSFVVQGSAGSGKTIMAVRKSVIFGSLPLQSCIVLVYTKALKLMLQNGLDYYSSIQRINHKAKAVYAWAWKHRRIDLEGEVFRKKGDTQELYLRNGNTITTYRRCDTSMRTKYEVIYNNYLANFPQMTVVQRKEAEESFSEMVSIDFADYVTGELYSTYGRRTSFFSTASLNTRY